METETPTQDHTAELLPPDKWRRNAGAIACLRVWQTESHSTAVALTREQLQAIVQQAYELHGITPAGTAVVPF